MVSKKVEELLNKQLNMEIFSGYLYLEIANYFISEGLDGFGHWFNMQVKEELDHGRIILNYMHDNGLEVKLEAIDNPSRDYKNHKEALQEVFDHERLITNAIHDLYQVAMDERDYRTTQFLDWFIEEQHEEEATAGKLLSDYEVFAKDGKSLFPLDRELGNRVYTSPEILTEE